MKKIGFLIALIPLMQSCQYFEKNVPAKEELLQKELNKINWQEVALHGSLRYRRG